MRTIDLKCRLAAVCCSAKRELHLLCLTAINLSLIECQIMMRSRLGLLSYSMDGSFFLTRARGKEAHHAFTVQRLLRYRVLSDGICSQRLSIGRIPGFLFVHMPPSRQK